MDYEEEKEKNLIKTLTEKQNQKPRKEEVKWRLNNG